MQANYFRERLTHHRHLVSQAGRAFNAKYDNLKSMILSFSPKERGSCKKKVQSAKKKPSFFGKTRFLSHTRKKDSPLRNNQYRQIKRVAVVGAGTMGSQIAAHIANVGIPCDLLDIPPTELNDEERANDLTLDNPAVRNRIAQSALDRMKSAKTSLAVLRPRCRGVDSSWQLSRSRRMAGGCGLDH